MVAVHDSKAVPIKCRDKKSNIKGYCARDHNLPKEALPTKSGYLPISPTSKSKLFYVFYEAINPIVPLQSIPWLLWLNGGPGCSSLIGCFYEVGPWWILEDGSVQFNQGTWNKRCGVLFVDNPIGTGFSIVAGDDDVPEDHETAARHLEYALHQFVCCNPTFKARPLFLAGESYAGKYIPALAYQIIHQPSPLRSQLVGIAIGNGFTDPCCQVQAHAKVLHAFGMLDLQQAAYVQQMATAIVNMADKSEWQDAHEKRVALCKWIEQTCGIKTMLDIRRSCRYHHLQNGSEYLEKYLNSKDVRKQLNVDGNALPWVSCRRNVRGIMAQDTMKSAKGFLEVILEKGLAVLLYQGMFDVKDGPAGTEEWMHSLNWSHIKEFWESERTIWKSNGVLAGYRRSLNNLTHVVFVGAGHQVPADQPVLSLRMLETWIGSILKPYQAAKL